MLIAAATGGCDREVTTLDATIAAGALLGTSDAGERITDPTQANCSPAAPEGDACGGHIWS